MSMPTMDAPVNHFYLPDLIAVCPYPFGHANPHYKEAAAESRAWVDGYNIFTDRKRAYFVQGSNELLVCRAYPWAGYEEFRTCCDFVNLLFSVDEFSDEQNGKDARRTGETCLRAMRDPTWTDGSPLARMSNEFRARLTARAGPGFMSRFLKHLEDYIEAVATEAELRERGTVLDLASYTPLRRENSAVRLCFTLNEYVLGVDLPDGVFEDPVFIALDWAGVDMICLSNDVYSYAMEESKGIAGNNYMTVLMHDKHIDIQTAADYIGAWFKELMDRYVQNLETLPSWGPDIDANVAKYLLYCRQFVVGNLQWSFETIRYFGPAHDEVKRNLRVNLLPKEIHDVDCDEGQPEEAMHSFANELRNNPVPIPLEPVIVAPAST